MGEFFRGINARTKFQPSLTNMGGGAIGRSGFRPSSSGIVKFYVSPQSTQKFTITGQTQDASGSPLGFCTVELELTSDGSRIAMTTSDASGNYQFQVAPGNYYQVSAYLPGSPDRAGITLNTLVGI